MNMRNETCVETQTSKVPTRVALLFISILCHSYRRHLYSQQQPKFAMALDLDRELLASDNETSPSSVLPPSTTVSTSLPMDASGTQQLFQQFVQILDNKLDHKLASFKRNFDDKDEHHASQLKKLKLESKATSSLKFKGNKLIQYEFNAACIDSLEKVSKCVLDGDLSKASDELQAPTSISKAQLPPPKTNLFTDSRHAMLLQECVQMILLFFFR